MHIPVLLAEAVDALFTRPDGLYVDGTFGRGGHARALLARLSPQGRLVVFDKDPLAIAEATGLAAADARVSMVHAGFGALKAELAARGIGRIAGLLLDLGVSSPQLDEPQRGFSFRHDAPLDMRMDSSRGETAAEYLQRASYGEIVETLRELGEERFAAAVARALVARRDAGQPVRTTAELAQVVAGAVRTREPGQDPATRTFQALRIRINRELEELQEALHDVMDLLEPGGRLAVISFHSLEDRIVKQAIVRESRAEPDRRVPHAPPPEPRLRALGRTRPGAAEVAANPRARSATLRWAERTSARQASAESAESAPAGAGRRPARA